MSTAQTLREIYQRLYKSFGPQHWWPAQEPFEVIVGAILTQNTNWTNVERAIANLKKAKVITPKRLHQIATTKLARLIKPAGYFNIKAQRLKNFLQWFMEMYNGDIAQLTAQSAKNSREQLLSITGIGPETADSIILYALQKPSFVVDAYTYRIFSRHSLIPEETTYHEIQSFFHDNLESDASLFNEYHALVVRLGKEYCRKNNPKCAICPLKGINNYPS